MKIINPGLDKDYHIHSINYSDGLNTIDEIVRYAGRLKMKRIAITDHSQAFLDSDNLARRTFRTIVKRWKNVHNDVEVIFGVEADLLNRNGDVCFEIDGIESDFAILSAHNSVFKDKGKRITEGYLNALRRYHEKIKCIGHPDSKYFSRDVNIDVVIDAANEYGVPLEFNTANFVRGFFDLNLLEKIFTRAGEVMVNSDAHVLADLRDNRRAGFKYLKDNGLL